MAVAEARGIVHLENSLKRFRQYRRSRDPFGKLRAGSSTAHQLLLAKLMLRSGWQVARGFGRKTGNWVLATDN
jgi:hypothetical protein